jgi:hypothetical protein
MSIRVVGKCQFCDAEIKVDEKREAAMIPIYERAAKLGKLTCKSCAAKGVKGVDRDNPPDVRTQTEI